MNIAKNLDQPYALYDRISTRAELSEVVDLLGSRFASQAVAGSSPELDSQVGPESEASAMPIELWQDTAADEDQIVPADMGALTELFLGKNQAIN